MRTNEVDRLPDKKRCELCGAEIVGRDVDAKDERSGAEVIRRLAFLADQSPSLALLLIYHVVGRTEREIAERLKIDPATAHRRIKRAQQTMCNFAPMKTAFIRE